MSIKDRKRAVEEYKTTGFGFGKPKTEQLQAPVPSPTGTTAKASLSPLLSSVPAMPTITLAGDMLQHRIKIADIDMRLMTLCVARSVSKKEAATKKKDLLAMEKE